MQEYQALSEFPDKSLPLIVTIGNYDGIHLGHQKVINTVVQEAKKQKLASLLVTFKNHPAEVLGTGKPIFKICTPLHKKKLISALGIDYFLNLTFTKEFSEQDPETFLKNLQKEIYYRKLILGHDAKFGRKREGDREKIVNISKTMGFEIEYLPLLFLNREPVTSSKIRGALMRGEFELVSKLLGRPYSILTHVERGQQMGRVLGVSTANLPVTGLALPPFGVYLVKVNMGNAVHSGIANLGIAPTVRKEGPPKLEVHLFDFCEEIYGVEMEVFFIEYLRQEITFSSKDDLAAQMQKDIANAKAKICKRQ